MKRASCLSAQLHKLSLTVIFSFLGIFSVIGCQISCKSNVLVSLDQNGEALLTPSLFLTNATDCTGSIDLTITANSSVITDNTLRCAQVGQNIIASVTESETQISCWTTVAIFDYNPPKFLNCVDVFVPCHTTATIDELSTVTLQDNCDPNPTINFTESTATFACDTYSKIVTRTHNGFDNNGNHSSPCVQNIFFEAITLGEVLIPANIVANDCNNFDTTPETTGYPNASGISDPATHCGFYSQFTDETFSICGNTYKIFRNWTVYDWCGNPPVTGTQVIELIDDTPPVIECPTDTILFGSNGQQNCTGDVVLNLITTDDCGSATLDYQWNFSENETNVPVGIHSINAIATDECGNESDCLFHIEVKDTDAPIAICESDFAVSLSNVGTAVIPAISFDNGSFDNCGITDRMIGIDSTFATEVQIDCEDIGNTLTLILMVVDACGNSSMCSSTVTVSDNTFPTINCPADITIDCSDDGTDLTLTGVATATDNCFEYTPTFTDNNNLTICNTGTITRTWQVIENGIEIKCDQTITLNAMIPTVVFPEDVTVNCGDFSGEPIVDYDCPGLFVGSNDEVLSDDGCTKITVKRWKVFNACTDGIWEQSQTVTEIDNLSPVFTIPAQNVFFDCGIEDRDAAVQNWLSNNGNANATDECSALTYSNSFVSSETGCANTESRTYLFTVTDQCGNNTSTSATIAFVDNTAPQFLIPPPDTTFSCNVKDLTLLNEYFGTGAASTFTDNCSNVEVTFNVDNNQNVFCGSYPVTIFLTDECGNVNSAIFMLTIIDEEAPVLTEEAKDLNLNCEADLNSEVTSWLAINGGATAFDRCVDVQWTNNYEPSALVCGGAGATVTFFANDACGNSTATSATLFIIDNETPQFTNPPQDITITCTDDIQTIVNNYLGNGNGATFTDNCGTPFLLGTLDDAIGSECATIGVNFTLIDNCNNSITSTGQITIEDNTPPIITQAPQDQLIECNENDIETNIQSWLNANGNAIATDDCSMFTWTNNYDGLIPSCDGTSEAQVTFTVTDQCGNSTSAIGTFRVQDMTPPTITFETSNATVECDGLGNEEDLQNWLQSNGGAFANDACGPVVWTNDFTSLFNSCGLSGTAEVNFTATDPCGNAATSTAIFTIIDTTGPEFLAAPMDLVTECDGMGNTFEFEIWSTNFGGGFAQDACGLVNTSFDISSTVLNCENGLAQTVTGLFVASDECGNFSSAFANFIINDTTSPIITCPEDFQEVDLDTNCSNDIVMEDAVAQDFCSNTFNYTIDIDYNQTGEFDILGQVGQNASGAHPVGTHLFYYNAIDQCGNVGTCQQVVDIIDIVSPQITCNNFVIYLDENGIYEVFPDTIGSFSDTCGDVIASVDRDTLTCEDPPTVVLTLSVQDNYGNVSSCMRVFAVVDTFGICDEPQGNMAMISGNLYREDMTTVENTTVILSDGMSSSMTSNNDGGFNFMVNPGFNYTVTPMKDDDPKNGVTTIDLITLQQHIIGAIPIVSPYQLIAADANNSGSISTLDLVEIQQLILEIIPEFTNNTSWRFVDESFVFPSPANPFASYFPETTSFNNLSGVSQNNDFIAIKIGDVNGSATTGNLGVNLENRNTVPTYLFAENRNVEQGEMVNMPIAFHEEQSIDGYQFQVLFDTDAFEFIGISNLQLPNLTMDNFGLKNLESGIISTNWINTNQYMIPANESLFTIQLRAKAPTNLKDLISIDPSSTYNEIYKKNKDGILNSSPLHLTFNDYTAIPNTGKDQVFLYQNAPNPFEDRTSIRFNLPQLTKSTVSIYDATGRLVWQVSKEFPAGENQVTIESRDLGLAGVYIYTLDTEYGRQVKKMILMSRN